MAPRRMESQKIISTIKQRNAILEYLLASRIENSIFHLVRHFTAGRVYTVDKNQRAGNSDRSAGSDIVPDVDRPAPIAGKSRIVNVDILRGCALLGILTMNIYAFGLPFAAYENPLAWGGTTGLNLGTWFVTHLLCDLKFMAIFSMLFGAGLVLMTERTKTSGQRFAGIYYRRIFWLLVIGMFHAYCLWLGDILVPYAVCGLLIYLFRRRSGRFLIILGLIVLLLGAMVRTGGGLQFKSFREISIEADAALSAGQPLTHEQEVLSNMWRELQSAFDPSQEEIRKDIAACRGDYAEGFKHRAPIVFMMQTQAMVFMFIWRVGGLMLLGMGLMKLGVFSGQRSTRFYTALIVAGYGLGLPLIGYGAIEIWRHGYDFVYGFQIGGHYNYFGSLMVAGGHVGAVMLICKSRSFAGLKLRLAAVGRMALSNYLMHSVICTTIFYGFGLGLFGTIGRFPLMGFVVAIWILQLYISPIWLRHFQFGPAEWLWRTLTYWRSQPMKASCNRPA